MKLPIGSGAIESLIRQVVNLRAHWHGQVLAVAECRNHVTRKVPMGSRDMGMGFFLRRDPDCYALSCLTTRCVERYFCARSPANFSHPTCRSVAPISMGTSKKLNGVPGSELK